MHPSAIENAQHFFNTYAPFLINPSIVEIGSQDVNGSLRTFTPANASYLGVDFVEGKGVDLVLKDPYHLPLPDESADIVASSSCFEHSELFWLVFLEIMRILKPKGLFYLNAPSNGQFHQYPLDCWRFYPDSGKALITWGQRNGLSPALLESYISPQCSEGWSDYVAVFVKEETHANAFPRRISTALKGVSNVRLYGQEGIQNIKEIPEDQRRLQLIKHIVLGNVAI